MSSQATTITLSFSLEEAQALRTGLGTLGLLHDALTQDMGHVNDDEHYGIGAARIAALHGMVTALMENVDYQHLQACVSAEIGLAHDRASGVLPLLRPVRV